MLALRFKIPPRELEDRLSDEEIDEYWRLQRVHGLDDLDDVVWAILASQGGKLSFEDVNAIRRPYSRKALSDSEAERRAM